MLSVSEKCEFHEEVVSACVTVRKLTLTLVSIIWHVTFSCRYHHLKVGISVLSLNWLLALERGFLRRAFLLKNNQHHFLLGSDIGSLLYSGVFGQVWVW